MSASTTESKKQREVQVTALTQQKQRLEDRLERMYMDKLDGVISDEEFARLSKKFRSDLTDTKFNIEQLTGEKEVNIDNGRRLLELVVGGRGTGAKLQAIIRFACKNKQRVPKKKGHFSGEKWPFECLASPTDFKHAGNNLVLLNLRLRIITGTLKNTLKYRLL